MIERHLKRWAPRRTRREHLGDDALLEALLARLDPTAPPSRHTTHVTSCEPCSAAVSRLGASLDEATRAARYVADETIGADRLARQLEVIDRRLDGQPARLLRFPVRARAMRTQPGARRWVAMAAACGLLFGLAAGRMLGPAPAPSDAGAWPTGAADREASSAHEPVLADEHLLVEVDAALARTLHREFRVLDELTPRSVDVRRGRR